MMSYNPRLHLENMNIGVETVELVFKLLPESPETYKEEVKALIDYEYTSEHPCMFSKKLFYGTTTGLLGFPDDEAILSIELEPIRRGKSLILDMEKHFELNLNNTTHNPNLREEVLDMLSPIF